jgi:tetratricopeptide (TPR) repeat protein
MTDRIAQLERLLKAEPNDPFCLYGLAQEFAKAGNLALAIEYYDRVIGVDPDSCYAYFHKARCQAESGRRDDARRTVEAGLTRARRAGDAKAAGELADLLEELT